jgi:hypothetical protein
VQHTVVGLVPVAVPVSVPPEGKPHVAPDGVPGEISMPRICVPETKQLGSCWQSGPTPLSVVLPTELPEQSLWR